MERELFWIAVNQDSAAMNTMLGMPFASRQPRVIPTPECLVGFSTESEVVEAQRMLLNDPIPKCQRAIRRWERDPNMKVVHFPNPEPPRARTEWIIEGEKPDNEQKQGDSMRIDENFPFVIGGLGSPRNLTMAEIPALEVAALADGYEVLNVMSVDVRNMQRCGPLDAPDRLGKTVWMLSGFDDDPRDLSQIPDARAMLLRYAMRNPGFPCMLTIDGDLSRSVGLIGWIMATCAVEQTGQRGSREGDVAILNIDSESVLKCLADAADVLYDIVGQEKSHEWFKNATAHWVAFAGKRQSGPLKRTETEGQE